MPQSADVNGLAVEPDGEPHAVDPHHRRLILIHQNSVLVILGPGQQGRPLQKRGLGFGLGVGGDIGEYEAGGIAVFRGIAPDFFSDFETGVTGIKPRPEGQVNGQQDRGQQQDREFQFCIHYQYSLGRWGRNEYRRFFLNADLGRYG